MKTDSIFYRLFQTFPRAFFDLLGLPADTVEGYRFASVEVKQLSFRLDGVFLPDNLTRPLYFLEVQFQRDELGERESVGINTLKSSDVPETGAIERGKTLIRQVRQELTDPEQQRELLELIETILVYKLPKINRKEIEAMFSLSDLKQTRVYQEALEEGRQEGRMESRQEGRQEGRMEEKIETVRRMVALGFNAEQIAAGTGLTIEEVRGIIASGQGNGDT